MISYYRCSKGTTPYGFSPYGDSVIGCTLPYVVDKIHPTEF